MQKRGFFNKGNMEFWIVTWNVNFSARAVEKYKEFSFEHRKKYILANLRSFQEKADAVIFLLQEVMPEYIDALATVFPSDFYSVYTKEIHPSGRMLYTAVPVSLCVVPAAPNVIPLIDGNTRDCWDVFCAKEELYIVNLHAPMDTQFRLPICQHVASKLKTRNVIIAGDLNTFSDSDGLVQVQMMERTGLRDVSSTLLRATVGSPTFEPSRPYARVLETFDPYPYDSVPRDNPEFFPFNLDHIFASTGIETGPVLCYDQERDVIFEGKNYGNSDHFALSCKILYKK